VSVKYKINGKEVTKEEWDAKKGVGLKGGVPLGTIAYRADKPLLSDGMGCMKSQVGEMRDVIKKHNIQGVFVRDNGQLEITSRRGRRELLKVRGLVDADAGYSD
jgi:hypothetical protein